MLHRRALSIAERYDITESRYILQKIKRNAEWMVGKMQKIAVDRKRGIFRGNGWYNGAVSHRNRVRIQIGSILQTRKLCLSTRAIEEGFFKSRQRDSENFFKCLSIQNLMAAIMLTPISNKKATLMQNKNTNIR